MIDNIRIGRQIARLRKKNKLSQEKLAEILQITAQAISKWENGKTLPETAQLPVLAQLFECSIDSILMPLAEQEAAFRKFAETLDERQCRFALELYNRIREKIEFDIHFSDEFYVFEKATKGMSVAFNNLSRNDFIIRLDVKTPGDVAVRIALPNCAEYIGIIEQLPESGKKKFRRSDCKCCSRDCRHAMVYTFEGVDYRQCHFVTYGLLEDNMEHILTLVFAEYGC